MKHWAWTHLDTPPRLAYTSPLSAGHRCFRALMLHHFTCTYKEVKTKFVIRTKNRFSSLQTVSLTHMDILPYLSCLLMISMRKDPRSLNYWVDAFVSGHLQQWIQFWARVRGWMTWCHHIVDWINICKMCMYKFQEFPKLPMKIKWLRYCSFRCIHDMSVDYFGYTE